MEKSNRFVLADYYRDLETVEKNLSLTNNHNKKLQKQSQQKTQLPRKSIRQSFYQSKRDEVKNKKLIIRQTNIQQNAHFRIDKYIPGTGTYSECMGMGQRSAKKKPMLDNLSPNKSQNPMIILQIKGFDEEKPTNTAKNDEKGPAQAQKIKSSQQKQAKKAQNETKSANFDVSQDCQDQWPSRDKVENRKTESETLTDSLLQVLKHRNSIYALVKRNCEVKNEDYVKQFERIWQKSILYKKLVERINFLLKKS